MSDTTDNTPLDPQAPVAQPEQKEHRLLKMPPAKGSAPSETSSPAPVAAQAPRVFKLSATMQIGLSRLTREAMEAEQERQDFLKQAYLELTAKAGVNDTDTFAFVPEQMAFVERLNNGN